MVREVGLEPTHFSAQVPKTCASTIPPLAHKARALRAVTPLTMITRPAGVAATLLRRSLRGVSEMELVVGFEPTMECYLAALQKRGLRPLGDTSLRFLET